uniref:hypothetical protein n=1 Tax=Fuscoporia viticola TaxID=139386 RepID=UPI0023AB04D0|nr:hypothetical protein P1Q19_mgp05 [Fuscoporia viticola]WCF76854.1 hypothetical protein [Fuscoporia viticola]
MKNLFNQYILSKIDKNSFYLGFMKAYHVPVLPKKIDLIYSNIYIRILRFIGGICLLLTLTNSHLSLPIYLHIYIAIIGAIQSIQIVLMFIIKFIYGLYTLIYKPKEFEVRNSPLNHFALHYAKILYCAKMGCVVTGTVAGTVAAGASFDSVLEAAGRERFFVPMLGSMYKTVFGEMPDNRIKDVLNSTKSEVKSDNSSNLVSQHLVANNSTNTDVSSSSDLYPNFPLNLLYDIETLVNAEVLVVMILINIFTVQYLISRDYTKYIPDNKFGKYLNIFLNRYITIYSKSNKFIIGLCVFNLIVCIIFTKIFLYYIMNPK